MVIAALVMMAGTGFGQTQPPATNLRLTSFFRPSDGEFAKADAETSKEVVRQKSGWEFELAPYLWTASLHSEVSAGPISAVSDVCFTDLVKHLNVGGMVRFEGRKDSWGFYVDGLGMALNDEARARIGPFRLRGLATNVDVTLAIVEFGGFYRLGDSRRSFDVLAGGRYLYLGTDVSVQPFIDRNSSSDLLDPVVGGRFRLALADRWLASLKADFGGFGVGTDLTWNITVLLGYMLTERATLAFGYRYFDLQKDQLDLILHGPMIGIAFTF